MLQRDNVVAPGALGLADLGIAPKAMEAVVPGYLQRFRSGGGRRRSSAAERSGSDLMRRVISDRVS